MAKGDGPKDAPDRPEDQKCVLCDKWFSIFQVDHTAVKIDGKSTFVYICHGDRLAVVRKAVEVKLDNEVDKARRVTCLRCQPGGDLHATCTCGAIQHPRHERCGGSHAYGACPLDEKKCKHMGDFTFVHGGGRTCNSCGDYV